MNERKSPKRNKTSAAKSSAKAVGQDWFGGIHSVLALLETMPTNIRRLCATGQRGDARMRAVLRLAEKNGIAVEERDADAIENLAGEHAQGVAALSDPPPMVAESELKNMCAGANANGESGGEGDLPLFVVIDRVWDPRNLGACLRSAAACSVTAVVVPKAHVSALSPTVLRASAGMAARVPVVRASNLARCLQGLRDSGIWIAGLDSGAPDSLYAFDCRRPLAFVLGSEGKGMRQLTRAQCDYHISIPMSGAVESLNLSVATAVCLFEASRQRTQAP